MISKFHPTLAVLLLTGLAFLLHLVYLFGSQDLSRGIIITPVDFCTLENPQKIQQTVLTHFSQNPLRQQPTLLLLLGGAGTGKGTFLKKNAKKLKNFVNHGLDEYLQFVDQFEVLFKHPEFVFTQAADSCYPSLIPLARSITNEIIARRLDLIYEETGKNAKRLKERVLPPFVEAGYKIIAVEISTDPDVAVLRAFARFLRSGRFASETYVRSSFPERETLTMFRDLIRCTNDCRDEPRVLGAVKSLQGDCMRCDRELDLNQ